MTSFLDFKCLPTVLTQGIMAADLLPSDLSQPVDSCGPPHPLTLLSNIAKEFKFAKHIW